MIDSKKILMDIIYLLDTANVDMHPDEPILKGLRETTESLYMEYVK